MFGFASDTPPRKKCKRACSFLSAYSYLCAAKHNLHEQTFSICSQPHSSLRHTRERFPNLKSALKLNAGKLLSAGKDVAKAITLSDDDIARLSRESVEWMDAHNPVADDSTSYGARLKRLTEGITEVDGLPLNFKVYLVVDVNAFACGDGSIRVFAALMDLMDDDELMSIIGHEIGHVVHADTKHAMKNAYLASAARNAAGAAEGSALAKLSNSQLGEVVTATPMRNSRENRSMPPTNTASSSP